MAHQITIEEPTLTPEQEQQKWLGETLIAIEERKEALNDAMNSRNTVAVLKAASGLLSELRTGMLTPQHYYEVYMKALDQLTALEMYFLEEVQSGRVNPDTLYQTVQHAGNIVPRLYLLIVVAAVYVRVGAGPAKEILMDLIELCKGVQHPTRGLFLRHFLLTMMKNKLPDTDNQYSGTVTDSAAFIIGNFREMVWLWFRMESKPQIAKKERRDRERRELRVLVGFNLVRLSLLEGIDKTFYVERVLPLLLRIILDYPDAISQQYLLEVVVQVFGDDYHLLTLDALFDALGKVTVGVSIPSILNSLMDRLGVYAEKLRDGSQEATSKKENKIVKKMFEGFQAALDGLAAANRAVMTPGAYAECGAGLMKLAVKAYPGEDERVNGVVAALHAFFQQQGALDAETTKSLRRTCEALIALYQANPGQLLEFPNFPELVQLLSFTARRQIAISFAKMVTASKHKIGNVDAVTRFFDLLAPLMMTLPDTPADKTQIYTIDVQEEFAEEQGLVCRTLHVIDTPDLAVLSKIFSGMRKQLSRGGPERTRYTYKAMVALYARLAIRCAKAAGEGADSGVNVGKIFSYLHSGDGNGMLETLAELDTLQGISLYVFAANAADTCGMGDNAYDLFAAALMLYEHGIPDTKRQMAVLSQLVSALAICRSLEEESYKNLAAKLCQYASSLLLKQDQCRMVQVCSHLFWKKTLSDEARQSTNECLQRSLKMADKSPSGAQYDLYVESLNRYLYYFSAKMPQVQAKHINSLVDMCNKTREARAAEGGAAATADSAAFEKNTKAYIRHRKQDQSDERWAELE